MFKSAALALILLLAAAAPAIAEEDHSSAKEEFNRLCAPCHGVTAKGNGPAAASMKVQPADLTAISKRNGGEFPRDAVFDTIVGFDRPMAHGSQDMPVWGSIFIDDAIEGSIEIEDAKRATTEAGGRIASLVDYIESLQEP